MQNWLQANQHSKRFCCRIFAEDEKWSSWGSQTFLLYSSNQAGGCSIFTGDKKWSSMWGPTIPPGRPGGRDGSSTSRSKKVMLCKMGSTFDSLWYRWNRLPIFLFKETLCVYERLNIFYKLCICERLQIISKTCTTEGYTSRRHCVWVGYVPHHYKAVYPHCIIKQALSTSGRLHHLKERVQMEHAIHFIRLALIKRHCTYVTELVIL